jgi:guanylate kinase
MSTTIVRRGLMFVLSSPSGAGKSTLTRLLLQSDRELEMSVSVTTRAKRPSEVNGVHYHFIDALEFQHLRDDGKLLESATVHGNSYGTPKAPVDAAMEQGRDIIFDIDWQGTQQLRDRAPADIVSVFLLPPSAAELRQRLERRAEDASATIDARLRNAAFEIEHWREYDYVLVNDDLDRTFEELKTILRAERMRRTRRPGIAPLAELLAAELSLRP